MKTSVIIPTLNEEGNIQQLLDSLKNQTRPADEILVIDGGSKDKTRNIAKKYAKVFTTNASVAHQRNLGAKKASGDLLIFLDADTNVSRVFLQQVVHNFQNQPIDIACPTFVPKTNQRSIKLLFSFLNHTFKATQSFLPSGAGMCIIVQKKVFEASSGFDPTSNFEDMCLIRQIGSAYQYKILPIPVTVSVRRFEKEGTFKLSLKYIALGILFTFSLFDLAEKISYPHRSKHQTTQ